MKNQRWLSWLLLFVMGYLIYSGAQAPRESSQTAATSIVPPITAEKYPALAEATDIEGWKRKLNPDYAAVMNCTVDESDMKTGPGFKVIEDAPGKGDGAVCGKTVNVQLSVWNVNGGKSYDAKLAIALGSRQIAAGFDYGLLGIKVDGVRTLVLPPKALVRNKAGDASQEPARKALPINKLAIVTVKRLPD